MRSSELLAEAARAFAADPDRIAVVDDRGQQTWSELTSEITRAATELELDSPGGPIGILLPSSSAFLCTFLATVTLGRAACTLHPDWAGPELEAAITDVGLSTVVSDRSNLPDPKPPGEISPIEPEPSDENSIFYIGFTSGTSGRPKPFARRQRSWTSSFGPAGELFSIESGDRVFLPGSLQHSHFLFGAVLGLNRGASVRLFERFDAETLTEELADASRAVLYLVPTMLIDLDWEGAEPIDHVHSVVIAGAKMEPHHWEIARRLFPEALIGEFYGASELSFVTVNTEGESISDGGYVGRPFPGVEVDIRPTEESAEGAFAEDKSGVVWVRSPYLFDGYLEGSQLSSPADADGFMTVGDVGVIGDRGLSLVGRASNMLITGGKNVHPEEIEAQLATHPDVFECVVIGVPHPRWGEEITAFIVSTDPDVEPDVDSLRMHLRDRVAGYKIPKRWLLVDEIPRTQSGKTARSPKAYFGSSFGV